MLTAMVWNTAISGVACAGHLAFALTLWLRRERANIALPLSLLFLDTFVWTFASLAFSLTGALEWHWVDHVFSSFLPGLMVQVVAGFVGRARALRHVVGGLYGVAAAIALCAASGFWWWRLLLVYGPSCALFCCILLLWHRARTEHAAERRRTLVLLCTILIGTSLATTDLWADHLPGLPRVANLGMLLSLLLVAICALRLRLLGRDLPLLPLALTFVASGLLVAAALTAARSLPARVAIASLALLSISGAALVAVREVSRAREREAERLQELVALGQFSEQLAHDLKNPLAALKGGLQFLMQERALGRTLDEQAPFLALMLAQVERTSHVVDGYQRLASVQPVPRLTSLNELVGSVLDLQRFASAPGIRVSSKLEPSLPECELDADLLRTTLENLLKNAFDAMPDGGEITVETRRAMGRAGTPGVSLVVRDDGAGMDARVLERAIEQSFTTKPTGSGLGLSFADRVARAHQGSLDLSSELGRGTTVRVWVPLHPME